MYIQKEVKRGYNAYLTMGDNDCATNMDVGLLVMSPGDDYTFTESEKEIALDILIGKVTFSYNGETREAVRKDTFRNAAYCLHVCKGINVTVKAIEHSEIYVQKTDNDREFPARLYAPSDIMIQHAGANGELLGCMQREIQTFFDYESAPYSNMVLGEVLSYPGKWSSYPPHHHPQPEVYFYRFDYPQGFGAGFADGEVYQTGHNGCLVINHSFHSQAAAPGYAMCYTWGIRHIPGNPWRKTRIDDPEHSWLWKSDANEHIFRPEEVE